MKYLIYSLILSYVACGVLNGGNSQANAVLVDAQGRILTAGLANNITSVPSNMPDRTTDFALARYLPDGSLDPTFNPTGFNPGMIQFDIQEMLPPAMAVVLEPIDEGITALAFDQNNKIIAAGFASVGLNSTFVVARFNEDGSLDTTFNANGQLGTLPGIAFITFGMLGDVATGVAVDSHNRIVVVGSSDNGQNIDLIVIRLTEDGMLDPTFNPFSPVIGSPAFNFTAITTGQETPLFRSPGVLVMRDIDGIQSLTNQGDQSASAVVVLPDDAILVGGTLDNVNFTVATPALSTDFLIVKLTPTGQLDQTFNAQSSTPGIVTLDFNTFDDESFALRVDTNNRIVIGGLTNNADLTSFGLARYTPNGTLDTTFNGAGQSEGSPGTVITTITTEVNNIEVQSSLSVLRGLAIQDDNKIIAAGFTDNLDSRSFATIRYTEDGALDTTFNPNGLTPGVVIQTIEPSENTQNDTAITAENEGLGVALGQNNSIYTTGYSNDGLQNNFTTINYLETGALNTVFNANGEVSNQPGIVITPFGPPLRSLGNGVPIEVTEDLTGVSPIIIADLTYPPLPFEPYIYKSSLQAINVGQRMLSGQASPHAIISVFINEVPAVTTSANKAGVWSAHLPFLADGIYQATVVAIDPLTGVSLSSEPVSLSIEHVAPEIPRIISPTPGQRLTRTISTIRGTGQPGMVISIVIDGKEELETATTSDGQWHIQTSLSDGEHTLQAHAIDKAGKVSGISEKLTFEVATKKRVAPQIISPQSGATVASSTIFIRGTGQPNTTINVVINGTSQNVTTSSDGIWTVPLVEPTGMVTVQAFHDGLQSQKVRFSVQKSKPIHADKEHGGVLSGISEPESRISFYKDKKYLGSTYANKQGAWTYTPKGLPEGKQRIKLLVEDKKGAPLRMIEQNISL